MPTIRIHPLRCGEIGIPPELIGSGGDRFAAELSALKTTERSRLSLPVYCYLIEHPKGLLLIDTGLPESVADGDGKTCRKALGGAALYNILRPRARREELADSVLAARGIQPRDIKYVLLTHLDADHAGGVSLFREAGQILVAEEERFWAMRTNFRFVKPQWNYEPMETYWFRGNGIGPNGRSYRPFEDTSVELVNVPGHTFGSVVVLVRNAGRFAALCGDTAMDSHSWETLTVPGMAENAFQQRRALEWIATLAKDPACAAVLASHDHAQGEKVIEI